MLREGRACSSPEKPGRRALAALGCPEQQESLGSAGAYRIKNLSQRNSKSSKRK